MSKQIGYVRVSTLDQKTDRQLEGVKLDKVYKEKVSAKDTKRPELKKCLDYLRDGDTLHVHSIDRLARNLLDLQQLLEGLIQRQVTVRFHKEKLVFTGDDSPMQKLQLQMMGAFAEFERALIRERQREGIASAKARGKHLGRSKKLSQAQIDEIRKLVAEGHEKKALAAKFGVSRQTLYSVLSA
jgi:DNA invertase Pin-like site-specific DNA recombinase